MSAPKAWAALPCPCSDEQCVQMVVNGPTGECGPMQATNAHLISAAPEMYAVLQLIVDDAEPGEDARLSVASYNVASAALAKARGEQ